MTARYVYLGDRLTRPDLRNRLCNPVRLDDGRCIVSSGMASALVEFEDASRSVVARRRLRLTSKLAADQLTALTRSRPNNSE